MDVLGGLFRGKVDMQVSTDKRAYLPGETVRATLAITARDDIEVEEARAELVYENEYTYKERRYSGKRWRVEEETETERVVHSDQVVFGARTIRAGESVEESASFFIPRDAVPSGEGEITKVRWKVGLVLSREHRLDPDAETALRVLSPATAYPESAGTPPELDAPDDWKLVFRLPHGRDVGDSESVVGKFVVTASEETEVQEIRVELVQKEEVPREVGNKWEGVEQSLVVEEQPSFSSRIRREFAFDLPVPAGVCPTLRTQQSSVSWFLRGVVARKLRSDYNLDLELNVFSKPR